MENLEACILCGSPVIEWTDREFNVCRCRACHLVFENPRPVKGEIMDFYSRPTQYQEWLAQGPARDRLWKRRLAKMAKHRKPGKLLDIGTGIGQFLNLARPAFTEVVGTEVSDSAVAIARERYSLDVLQGEAEELDFQGKVFDNITLFHVLEHVPNPGRLISVCRSLLAPEGVLFIAVPNDIASLGALKRRMQGRLFPSRPRSRGRIGLPALTLDGSMDEIHLSHFTQGSLSRFISRAGFEILDNSLDPFYACSGLRLLKMSFLYHVFSGIHSLSGANGYGTIWISARKT